MNQKGLALPTALLLVMVIAIAGGIFVKTSSRNFYLALQDEATVDSYQISEGAVHSIISGMSSTPHLWRERVMLQNVPLNYIEYSQLNYGGTNGIPNCSGRNCMRNLYPSGGGLIKNFGPISSNGSSVNTTKEVWDQLNPSSLPTSDLTLNGINSYNQVERLDESIPSGTNLGTELTNNPIGGTSNKNVRFRVTGKTLRSLGTRTGESTLVAILEMPAS